MKELPKTTQVGRNLALVRGHRRRIIDDEYEVDLPAEGAIRDQMFQVADRLDTDRHEIIRPELRVIFVECVVLETILTDKAGVGRVGQLAGGTIERRRAVLRFYFPVQHVENFRRHDGAAGQPPS